MAAFMWLDVMSTRFLTCSLGPTIALELIVPLVRSIGSFPLMCLLNRLGTCYRLSFQAETREFRRPGERYPQFPSPSSSVHNFATATPGDLL